jgi:hypothetical protein
MNLDTRIRFENVQGDHRQIIAWLEENIEPANKRNSNNDPIPYYGSATSQIAKYAGQTSLWHLEVRGPQLKKVVEIMDPKMTVKFALKYSYAK